jgi:hypothetical protein
LPTLDLTALTIQDPRLLNYFDQIIHIPVIRHAAIFTDTLGIPRGSSLSPFFGVMYLSPLDKAFENCPSFAYFRYMDDIIILAKTARHYRRAKKMLFVILRSLQITLSPSKTTMGKLNKGFHFLGVQFEVPRSPHQNQVSLRVHPRSCIRALDRVKAQQLNAVHPATSQRYLIRWADGWSKVIPSVNRLSLLFCWAFLAREHHRSLALIGLGLLPWPWALMIDLWRWVGG